MNRFSFALKLSALVVLTLAASAPARAQARVWVSGLGDDTAICAFNTPCKTFGVAIGKVAMNGEISVLDSGAYGGVTIKKSITIDGHDNFASSLAAGAPVITINITDPADTRKTVRLRNLNLNGAGGPNAAGGPIGIRIIAADKVYIEDCLIEGFEGVPPLGRGISDERSGTNKLLFVTNTTTRNNRTNGIAITGGSALTAILDNVRVYGNGDSGILANSKVVIMNSNVSGNGNAGVHANTTNADVSIERTVIAGNTNHGVYSGPGAGATVRMSETMITRNASGITFGGGTIHTFGNCRIAGNTMGNGPPTSDLGGQQ